MGVIDVASKIRRPKLSTAHAEVYVGVQVLKRFDSERRLCRKRSDGRLWVHSQPTRISKKRIRVPRTVGTVPGTTTVGHQLKV